MKHIFFSIRKHSFYLPVPNLCNLSLSEFPVPDFLTDCQFIQHTDHFLNKSRNVRFFSISFPAVTDIQPVFCPGNRYIEESSLFLYIFRQECLFMRGNGFICIYNKYRPVFQSFGRMHGCQCDSILLFLTLPCLFLQFFAILFYFFEPFPICFLGFCRLRQFL